MKKLRESRAITLVALVITIILLLILAGISIQAITNTGLFVQAEDAKKRTENAQKEENEILQDYLAQIEGINVISVTEAQENEMLTKTANSTVKDANGNLLTVPAGFKIKVDDTTNNATTVDKGIVIIDSNENEFVWIPLGKIYTDTERTESNAKKIELNRYTFDENGNPTAQKDSVINSNFQELAISTKGNITAKDINIFKTSVETNRGFYIGRYEARTETARSSKDDAITAITENGSQYVYNYVTQIQAAELARNMYKDATTFTSDLINSYAWDTVTLFLQTFGTNSKYSIQNSINTSRAIKGTNNETEKDVQCNVYDMASNVFEWTTETSSGKWGPCVDRGGFWNDNVTLTVSRYEYNTSHGDGNIAFRTLLYINN